jgi:hypothetical protein
LTLGNQLIWRKTLCLLKTTTAGLLINETLWKTNVPICQRGTIVGCIGFYVHAPSLFLLTLLRLLWEGL